MTFFFKYRDAAGNPENGNYVLTAMLGNPGTPPGTYTLTITGNAGNLSHSTQVTLKVQ